MDFTGFVETVFEGLTTLLGTIIGVIVSVLPPSPFTFIEATPVIREMLTYVNFFIPISFFVSVIQAWTVAVVSYYVWQVGLRWAKAIN